MNLGEPTTVMLLAYDGSASAESAIRTAAALFPAARACVVTAKRDALTFEQAAEAALVALPENVVAGGIAALNEAAESEARETVAAGARSAAAVGLAAESRIIEAHGSPWRGLKRVADEIDADVIACGSRGMGVFSRAAVGSTSSGLLHHAACPVLVVPDEASDPDGPLLVGYDGSEPSRAAVARAGSLLRGRETLVVTIWESAIRRSLSGRALGALPNDELRAFTRDLDAYFRGVAAGIAAEGAELARQHGLEARSEAVEAAGAAWRGLLAAARTVTAAVVITGSRGRGAVASTVLGSVASGLVHNADGPVLVMPPDERYPGSEPIDASGHL